MKRLLCVAALLVALVCSSVSAQDIFWSQSYSTPDYGYGYSTQTYGWGGQLGAPLTPTYSSSWTSPDYGWGRTTSTYGYGGYSPSLYGDYYRSSSYGLWDRPSYSFSPRRHHR